MSTERSRDVAQRWRLLLGAESADALGVRLDGDDARLDQVLAELYGDDGESEGGSGAAGRRGGLGASAPRVARWLGDIRRYFPTSVVRVLQKDAMTRLGLERMLLEPELLAEVEPDVHLAATLVSLSRVMPERTRATARAVVSRIVDDLMRRLAQPLRGAVRGALARHLRNQRPRLPEIDWHRTIRANLKHYQPDLRTVVPERVLGHGRRRSSLRDVILCVDQSGSMATSVVYASVFGAVLASLPALTTRMIVFDTAVVDLTAVLRDPVDLLFGAQLGGGTDIHKALVHCESLVHRPHETVLVLISDLYDGGNAVGTWQTAKRLVASGVRVVVLLALTDTGRPAFDAANAARFASLDIPVFACTPDRFAPLMAAVLAKQDVALWAAANGVVLERAATR
jgi:Mg-chelatase subunit ChlD